MKLTPICARSRGSILVLITSLIPGGCDIPTSLPKFDTFWAVPSVATNLPLDEVLPGGVTVDAEAMGFTASLPQGSGEVPLRELCPGCAAFDGMRVLKPPFSGELNFAIPLPTGLAGGQVGSGVVSVQVQNGLGFDILRPGLSTVGSITIAVEDAEGMLGELVIDGSVTGLPTGQTLTRQVSLGPKPLSGDSLRIRVTVNSPLGPPAQIQLSRTLSVVASGAQIDLTSIAIVAAGRNLELMPVNLPFSDIDATTASRVRSARLFLDVVNPFDKALSMTLRLQGGGSVPLVATTSVPGDPTSVIAFDLSQEEVSRFLGQSSVTFNSSVTAPDDAPFTVDPNSLFSVRTRWLFQAEVGG